LKICNSKGSACTSDISVLLHPDRASSFDLQARLRVAHLGRRVAPVCGGGRQRHGNPGVGFGKPALGDQRRRAQGVPPILHPGPPTGATPPSSCFRDEHDHAVRARARARRRAEPLAQRLTIARVTDDQREVPMHQRRRHATRLDDAGPDYDVAGAPKRRRHRRGDAARIVRIAHACPPRRRARARAVHRRDGPPRQAREALVGKGRRLARTTLRLREQVRRRDGRAAGEIAPHAPPIDRAVRKSAPPHAPRQCKSRARFRAHFTGLFAG
jgi:hypothetical protein